MSNIWDLIVNNLPLFIFGLFVFWERKTLFQGLFLEPIRGGNGQTQMDELAKWVLIWVLVYMVHLEGQSAEQVYPESWGWAVIMGIFLIAGYEKIVEGIVKYLEIRLSKK